MSAATRRMPTHNYTHIHFTPKSFSHEKNAPHCRHARHHPDSHGAKPSQVRLPQLQHHSPGHARLRGSPASDGGTEKKYEAEASYNEQNFKRQFAEFLQGQKDFPQNILLKRQRSLQDAMEKSLSFRHDVDSILTVAEREALAPVRKRLDDAIRAVGLEHGYEYILNTDANAYPFVHHSVAEDATAYVEAKLK